MCAEQSLNLSGEVARTVAARDFPLANVLMDPSRYDYEGNWAFCVFDSEEIPAARFGFGAGAFDLRDYGPGEAPSREFMLLQMEMMTREGAVLWLANCKYKASQILSDPRRMEVTLNDGARRILRISGWPTSLWQMSSDDGQAELEMEIAPESVTILPDQKLRRNLFAMWLTVGKAKGWLRYNGRRVAVKGTAFYDHPRTSLLQHKVPPLGRYLYMPIAFEDGSRVAAYHTVDATGRCVEDFCFALFISPDGRAQWLPGGAMPRLACDPNGFPTAWSANWLSPKWSLSLEATVRETGILKAWGSSGWGGGAVPQTRAENRNLPLVFDCTARVTRYGRELTLRGKGMAEYVLGADTEGS